MGGFVLEQIDDQPVLDIGERPIDLKTSETPSAELLSASENGVRSVLDPSEQEKPDHSFALIASAKLSLAPTTHHNCKPTVFDGRSGNFELSVASSIESIRSRYSANDRSKLSSMIEAKDIASAYSS